MVQQQLRQQETGNGATAAAPSSFTTSDASVWGNNFSIIVVTPTAEGPTHNGEGVASLHDQALRLPASPASGVSDMHAQRHLQQHRTGGGQRPPHRTRIQNLVTMLDMRFDGGVWMLHPWEELNETRWGERVALGSPLRAGSSAYRSQSFAIGDTAGPLGARRQGREGSPHCPSLEEECPGSTRQGRVHPATRGTLDACASRHPE